MSRWILYRKQMRLPKKNQDWVNIEEVTETTVVCFIVNDSELT